MRATTTDRFTNPLHFTGDDSMRNLTCLAMALAIVIGFSGLSAQAATVTLTSVADTTLEPTSTADNNYGARDYINSATNRGGLVRFDLSSIPVGQVITSASLRLYSAAHNASQGTVTHEVYRETDAWGEGVGNGTPAGAGEASWNNRDGSTGSGWGGAAGGWGTGMSLGSNVLDSADTTGTGWAEWTVTSAVQGWYDGTYDNNGLLLIKVGGDWDKFRSREGSNSAEWPDLVVTYEVIPEPATMGLLAMGALMILPRRRR